MKVVQYPGGATGICTDEEAQRVHMSGGQIVGDLVPAAPPAGVSEAKMDEARKVYGGAPAADLVSGPHKPSTKVIPLEGAVVGARGPAPRLEEIIGKEKAQEIYSGTKVVTREDIPVEPSQREAARSFDGTAGRDIARDEERRREERVAKFPVPDEPTPPAPNARARVAGDVRAEIEFEDQELRRLRSQAEARRLLLGEAKRLARLAQRKIEYEQVDKIRSRFERIIAVLDSITQMEGGGDEDD